MQHSVRCLAAVATSGALLLAGCSSDDDGESGPPPVDLHAAPSNVTMRSMGGLKVPSSREDGPATSTPPEGYSHSPQGAALAAANGQAALATASDQQWAETVRTVTAPGAGRDEFAYGRTLMHVSGSVDKAQAAEFVGFKVTEYDPNRAVVLLATRTPQVGAAPLLTAYPVQTAWSSGDWKVVLPKQADNVDAKEIPSTDGFTAWEGPK